MTDFELVVLIAALYSICGFSGVISDMILGERAFGAVVNGFLLFVFLLVALVAYNEFYMNIRVAQPVRALGICLAAAFALLLVVAKIKNVLIRT